MTDSKQDLLEIFNNCVQAIETGQATIEDCLVRYADVDGLEDMLHSVGAIYRLPQPTMSSTRKDALAQQLIQQMKRQSVKQQSRPLPLSATFSLAMVLLIFFCSGLLFIGQTSPFTPPLKASVEPAVTLTMLHSPVISITSTSTLDDLTEKTKSFLTNPKLFNSFKAKLN